MLAREFYEIGERYYKKHGIGIHLVPRTVKYNLYLSLGAEGELVAELLSAGREVVKKGRGKKEFKSAIYPTVHVPNEENRTSGVFALFLNEVFETSKKVDRGFVGSPVRSKYMECYLKKHRELIPKDSCEEDEIFHMWLDSGLSTTFLTPVTGGGMFDIYINNMRAVEIYDAVFEKYFYEVLTSGVGTGLFGDEEGPMRDLCSKLDCQVPLFSYNDLPMYETNRPKLRITAKEDAYIRTGWNTTFAEGKRLPDGRMIGGIKVNASELCEKTENGNVTEILQAYKDSVNRESTALGQVILCITKPVQGRLENQCVIYEDAEVLFRNIAKFHEDCGFQGERYLSNICIDAKGEREDLKLSNEWLYSIWQNRPIPEKEMSKIVQGLRCHKSIDSKSFDHFLTSGVLNLVQCYLTRRGEMNAENYMYVVGKIMKKLNRVQKAKEPDRNVIYDHLKGMERPERMLSSALGRMHPYWAGDVPEDVCELLRILETTQKPNIISQDGYLMFFMGYANG